MFLKFFGEAAPDNLTEPEIRNYLLYLVEKKNVSPSTQNQAINAIKFLRGGAATGTKGLLHGATIEGTKVAVNIEPGRSDVVIQCNGEYEASRHADVDLFCGPPKG